MSAAESLLSRIVDYAGLFPPAGLDMESAVRSYQAALAGDDAWMLGSFVVPAARLAEFAELFQRVGGAEQELPLTLSVVCASEDANHARAIAGFQQGAVFLGSIETKAADAASAQEALHAFPEARACYIEFPPDRAEAVLPVLAAGQGRAKLRTGGLTPAAIPSIEAVAGFLLACARHQVPFKATAGLHHPVRGPHRLSPEGGERATMHGFLNLFLAASLAFFGAEESALRDALAEEEPSAFQLDDDLLRWRGYAFTADQLEQVRRRFAISFGSCSFSEPADDLRIMGWI